MKVLNKNKSRLFFCTLLILMIGLSACKEHFTPKPRSYYRIDFPEKKYIPWHSEECSYSFEIPVYARVVPFSGRTAEPCWFNIEFPGYKGVLHLTYKPLHENLNTYTEDVRTLAYKHSIKADDIIEKPFTYDDRNVNGIIYDIRGNTASSFSFFATDSTSNFLSGALYFNVIPNKDSLAPVIQFFTADVEHLIRTLKWN